MDQRNDLERALWECVGPPLYYCSCCLRAVQVKPVIGGEPVVERPCVECADAEIIAPRKAIAAGKGGLNTSDKVKVTYWKLAASLTGRCV